MNPTVLFVPDNGNQIRLFAPIARALVDSRVSVKTLNSQAYLGRPIGDGASLLSDIAPDIVLLPKPDELSDRGLFKNSRFFDRLALRAAALDALISLIENNLISDGFEAGRLLVVLGTDLGLFDGASITVLRRRGVRVALVQDGFISYSTRRPISDGIKRMVLDGFRWRAEYGWVAGCWAMLRAWRRRRRHPWGRTPVDACFVFGENISRRLAVDGVDPETIVVSGFSRLDDSPVIASGERAAEAQRHLPVRRIAYPIQPMALHRRTSRVRQRELDRMIINAILDVEDVKLCVRPHPASDPDDVTAVLKMAPGRAEVSREPNLWNDINAADMVVGAFSTVLLEAYCAGRWVAAISFPNMPASVYPMQSDTVGYPPDPEALARFIRDPEAYIKSVPRDDTRVDPAFDWDGEIFIDSNMPASEMIAAEMRAMLQTPAD